jgi:LPPG:FO 2-phospho-L-lactate transferase
MPPSSNTSSPAFPYLKVVALAGGVGGAKLADGLAQVLSPENLTVVVNTGDDFEHLGLYICPDLDTVCYTLAGMANPETGWGRMDESWQALDTLEALGGPAWFRLGDRDLGLHLERTRRMREGQKLSQVTGHFCRSFGIRSPVLPATDDRAPTLVYTTEGELSFQEYFVHRRCEPQVTGFRFENVEKARPAEGVLEALGAADLVIVCPSNPWVSVDPILALPGVRHAVQDRPALAVSPIIGGQTIKGPAAKMYSELGIQPGAHAVARHYGNLLDGFVLDHEDKDQIETIQELGMAPLVTDAFMKSPQDRARLAKEVVAFGVKLLEMGKIS